MLRDSTYFLCNGNRVSVSLGTGPLNIGIY
jgi:hypothetical protein